MASKGHRDNENYQEEIDVTRGRGHERNGDRRGDLNAATGGGRSGYGRGKVAMEGDREEPYGGYGGMLVAVKVATEIGPTVSAYHYLPNPRGLFPSHHRGNHRHFRRRAELPQRRRLGSLQHPPEVFVAFEISGSELLYEIHLSASKHVAATHFLVQNRCDGKATQELAHAMDFPSPCTDKGWTTSTTLSPLTASPSCTTTRIGSTARGGDGESSLGREKRKKGKKREVGGMEKEKGAREREI
ncbi:hypothetical protein Fmac_018301 [Flemingia macrophylla]|uniref:Uncharacterized protein n=1 Tax=Flemingia macrophylla TaxID=520843 RepID=A0ABD1M4K6_9FABA